MGLGHAGRRTGPCPDEALRLRDGAERPHPPGDAEGRGQGDVPHRLLDGIPATGARPGRFTRPAQGCAGGEGAVDAGSFHGELHREEGHVGRHRRHARVITYAGPATGFGRGRGGLPIPPPCHPPCKRDNTPTRLRFTSHLSRPTFGAVELEGGLCADFMSLARPVHENPTPAKQNKGTPWPKSASQRCQPRPPSQRPRPSGTSFTVVKSLAHCRLLRWLKRPSPETLRPTTL